MNMMTKKETLEEIKKVILKEYPGSMTYMYKFPVGRDEFDPDNDIALEIIVDKDKVSFAEESEMTGHMWDVSTATDFASLIYPSVVAKHEWDSNWGERYFVLEQGDGVRLC
jgi:hypothetical protein